MNRLIAILIFFLISSCNQETQTEQTQTSETGLDSSAKAPQQTAEYAPEDAPGNEDSIPATPADPIISIRKTVEKINTMKLETRRFVFMCDEKMIVDYFYADGKIVKIAVDYSTIGDVYAREAYYYDSGKLIFNYEFVEGGPACEGCIKTDEYRSYVLDNKVFKYLKNKTEASCRTCVFSSSSKQYRLLLAKTEGEMKEILCGL